MATAAMRASLERSLVGLSLSRESIKGAAAYVTSQPDERAQFELASELITRMADAPGALARLPFFCVLDQLCCQAKSARRVLFLSMMQANLSVALSVLLRGGGNERDEGSVRQMVNRVLDNWQRNGVFDGDALGQATALLSAADDEGDYALALDGGELGAQDDADGAELLGSLPELAKEGTTQSAAAGGLAPGGGAANGGAANGSPLSLGSSLTSSPDAEAEEQRGGKRRAGGKEPLGSGENESVGEGESNWPAGLGVRRNAPLAAVLEALHQHSKLERVEARLRPAGENVNGEFGDWWDVYGQLSHEQLLRLLALQSAVPVRRDGHGWVSERGTYPQWDEVFFAQPRRAEDEPPAAWPPTSAQWLSGQGANEQSAAPAEAEAEAGAGAQELRPPVLAPAPAAVSVGSLPWQERPAPYIRKAPTAAVREREGQGPVDAERNGGVRRVYGGAAGGFGGNGRGGPGGGQRGRSRSRSRSRSRGWPVGGALLPRWAEGGGGWRGGRSPPRWQRRSFSRSRSRGPGRPRSPPLRRSPSPLRRGRSRSRGGRSPGRGFSPKEQRSRSRSRSPMSPRSSSRGGSRGGSSLSPPRYGERGERGERGRGLSRSRSPLRSRSPAPRSFSSSPLSGGPRRSRGPPLRSPPRRGYSRSRSPLDSRSPKPGGGGWQNRAHSPSPRGGGWRGGWRPRSRSPVRQPQRSPFVGRTYRG